MKDTVSLRDIYDAIGNLENKVDIKINRLDDRVQKVEEKTDNLLGKIGIGVMIVSAFISSAVAWIFSVFKKDN